MSTMGVSCTNHDWMRKRPLEPRIGPANYTTLHNLDNTQCAKYRRRRANRAPFATLGYHTKTCMTSILLLLDFNVAWVRTPCHNNGRAFGSGRRSSLLECGIGRLTVGNHCLTTAASGPRQPRKQNLGSKRSIDRWLHLKRVCRYSMVLSIDGYEHHGSYGVLLSWLWCC